MRVEIEQAGEKGDVIIEFYQGDAWNIRHGVFAIQYPADLTIFDDDGLQRLT